MTFASVIDLNLALLRELDPRRFQQLAWAVYRNLGFDVEETRMSADGGADGFLKKGSKRLVLQVKRYRNDVGEPYLRDLYGTMLHSQADGAIMLTTGGYSKPAKTFVKGKNIRLITGPLFLAMLKKAALMPEQLPEGLVLDLEQGRVEDKAPRSYLCQRLTMVFEDRAGKEVGVNVYLVPEATAEHARAIVEAISGLSCCALRKWSLRDLEGQMTKVQSPEAVASAGPYASTDFGLFLSFRLKLMSGSFRICIPGPVETISQFKIKKGINPSAALFEPLKLAMTGVACNSKGVPLGDFSSVPYLATV